ncbi:hypothetical protein Tco_0132221, partial [Tanacetum coccineum]
YPPVRYSLPMSCFSADSSTVRMASMDDGDDVNDKHSFEAKVLAMKIMLGLRRRIEMRIRRVLGLLVQYGISKFLIILVLVVKQNLKELEGVPPVVSKIIESSFI